MSQNKETKSFQAEIQKLLNLMINSLYSHKEIFLRELISNASDALDKLRFKAQTNEELYEGDTNLKIFIEAEPKKRTLTISDNGIGMTREEVTENIGTIAKSGAKAFLDSISDKGKIPPELIGQFGVGFYSSFMVSDKVVIETRAPKADKGVRWESNGDGAYTIEDINKEKRGTTVTLYLKDKDKEDDEHGEDFTQEWTIRSLIKKHSDFVSYPITMNVEREEKPRDKDGKEIEGEKAKKVIKEETLNSMKAIWAKKKNEVTEEEHKEFYKHISHDWNDPLETIHVHAEGKTEYSALMYIPSKPQMDLFFPDKKSSIKLYVKRIFIKDNSEELLPPYLRFVNGVVDSNDLPLNISREMLQHERIVSLIKKNLIKKVIETLKNVQEKDVEKYKNFYSNFGRVLKEGIHYDFENQKELSSLLMYDSSIVDGVTTLKDYVSRMPSDQKEIYYITGENKHLLKNSPHLEIFKEKGYEVLLMTDPIDEWVLQALHEYDGKHLKSVAKGELNLDSSDKNKKEQLQVEEKKLENLIKYIKEELKDNIKEVKLSSRLKDSAVCLVADEHGMSSNMERFLKSVNQVVPETKRTLELNPNHELITLMNDIYSKDNSNPIIKEYANLLYEEALISEGSEPKDTQGLLRKITSLMVKGLKN